MRLLVLDGSRVLLEIVRRLTPDSVGVESATTFHEAERLLAEDPPDAAIVNLYPTELPWAEIQALCQEHSPPIPVLYESCIWHAPEDAGLQQLDDSSHFITKPYAMSDLQEEISRLLEWVHVGGKEPSTLH